MTDDIKIRELSPQRIDGEFAEKILLISRQSSWIAQQEDRLNKTKITKNLFVEEHQNVVISPVHPSTKPNIRNGGVFGNDGAPIELAAIWNGDQVVFGHGSRMPGEVCQLEIEEAIYAGPLSKHFGHFITEGVSRLHAAFFNDLPIVFIGKYSNEPRARLLPWMTDVLELIGINSSRIIVVEQPTLLKRLIVPNAGIELARSFSPKFIGMLRKQVAETFAGSATQNEPADQSTFLSRSRLSNSRRAIGETSLQNQLDANGWRICHPEKLPFKNQVAELCKSSKIAGMYGSQMHTLLYRLGKNKLDTIFFATSYFNQTYLHGDLMTSGLKIVAHCDVYDEHLPRFGNTTPYIVDKQIVHRAFEEFGISMNISQNVEFDYEKAWEEAYALAMRNKKLSGDQIKKIDFARSTHRS